MNDDFEKQKIAQSFGQAALNYHAQASLQQHCAAKLLTLLELWEVPPGAILEIGCGTGFLTQGLCDRFPNHPLQGTDLSTEMLHFCQSHLQIAPDRAPVSFRQMDGEILEGNERYGLIVANFVIQWFKHPVESLLSWLERLKPNGILCLAFPTCDSFPEWRQACESLQIPFTANSLPNPHTLIKALSKVSQDMYLQEEIFCTTHRNGSDFFRGLKSIGAGINVSGQKMSAAEMKKLIRCWDNSVEKMVFTSSSSCRFLLIQR
ncbi:MAG: methyltransferase [Leptolyngbyaceae cyanobacterium CSU_1_4]|nr:methyltransferase [Leptolyngbyaceae cyanobacterium CSU_1_4]